MTTSSPLAQRLLSVAALVPPLVALIWWSVWSNALLVALVAALALRELYAACRQTGHDPGYASGIALACALVTAATLQPFASVNLTQIALAGGVMLTLTGGMARRPAPGGLASWAITFAGACYIGGTLAFTIVLRQLDTPLRAAPLADLGMQPGAAWLSSVLLMTWGGDAVAYFVGRQFGRHPLAPSLSPRKSWEGAAGGLVGSALLGICCVWLCGLPIAFWGGALLGLVTGVAGPIGDLVESMIKRQIGLKDVGSMIPGHGGLLDRIDSILFAVPAGYLLAVLLTS